MNKSNECCPSSRFAASVLLLVSWLVVPPAAASDADVRILIDVSGSMKHNDPNNLRVPAMRLVSELMPHGTRAGVWLFAEDTSVLIEPGEVDEAWRASARQRLSSIHSRGLFTHIERAIDAAVAGWESETDSGDRHVVLLTDGVVDVSKTPGDSAASRARILAGQLQRLRSLGAHVHAIALSANVDKELLDALTSSTGGLLEQADSAERLQRIFLHMLEQTAAPVTVPLQGKQFDIDASVSELTLLIFRNGGEAVLLMTPDNTTLAAISPGEGVAWRSEPGYDLITVSNPMAGTWRFEGAEDPDNRAVIVTDLGIDMDPIAGTLLASEVADVNAWMTDHGAAVRNMDLLELVKASVAISGDEFEPERGELALDPERARFKGRLDGHALAAGDYRLSVTFDSGTFKREINRRVRFVVDPVSVQYSQEPGQTGVVMVDVVVDSEVVDVDSVGGYLAVTDAAGLVRAFPLSQGSSGGISVAVPASAAGLHEFEPNLYFTKRHGRNLHLQPAVHTVELTYAALPADPDAADEPAAIASTKPFSWAIASAYIGIGNLLLALGFAPIWWVFHAPSSTTQSKEAQPA